MQVTVTIVLAEGDSLAKSASDTAADMLVALGGDPSQDGCTVSISHVAFAFSGTALGAASELPPMMDVES